MTKDHLIAIARAYALIDGSYDLHAYLPRTETEAALWDPHEWVIEAMQAQQQDIRAAIREAEGA